MNGEHPRLLKQVRILDAVANVDIVADVLIVNNGIKAIETTITELPTDTQIINVQGLILGTGLCDLYSHSGEPGNETRETFQSLAASAASGGFTQVAILPDTNPSLSDPEVLASVLHKTQQISPGLPTIHFWATLSHQNNTIQMTELADLKDYAVGFTDQFTLSNLPFLRQALEYVKLFNKPIAIGLSHNELTNQGVIREGANSIRYGLPGNPGYSEASAIAAVLEIIDSIKTPVHLMRVSTARGVELIADAKQRGVPVTASTTWMHLLFSTTDIAGYNPNLRLEPPLGNPEDRLVLIDGVKQGIIDAIAIDHQAYTYEEKTVAFAEAPPGVVGLELALPILWQTFVASGQWTALELWHALSLRPRSCLNHNLSSIQSSQANELVLFDPQKSWTLDHNSHKSLGANTPWWGKTITGRTQKIWTQTANN
ncbi:MAG: dihydroorotase [Xenococcaceae cyanobacterium MO_207.B15]|nr:dihydroorotase [Xenococcaceae cyanobacterium MO_207.B15]